MGGDDNLKAELAKAIAECEYLREENARLKLRVGETTDRRPRPEQPPSLVKEKPQSSATVTVDTGPEVLRLGEDYYYTSFSTAPRTSDNHYSEPSSLRLGTPLKD